MILCVLLEDLKFESAAQAIMSHGGQVLRGNTELTVRDDILLREGYKFPKGTKVAAALVGKFYIVMQANQAMVPI